MPRDGVVFDMDGVLVDTLPGLRAAYGAFAQTHGFAASDAEFEALNGPSLREIVAILKQRHALAASAEELLADYLAEVEAGYVAVALLPDVKRVLEACRSLELRVALASSAPRRLVEHVLARFGLRSYFDAVVGGDEVARAKPAADIYARVTELVPDVARWFVLEDSPLGVEAARAAGMAAVHLVHDLRQASASAFAQAGGLRDGLRAILAAREQCRWIASCETAEVRILPGELPIANDLERAIRDHFALRARTTPGLHDGALLSYAGHEEHGTALVIEARRAGYRHFLAAMDHPEWHVPVAALGVSGVAFDAEGSVLLAERAAVAHYPGFLELVPSGGIDARHQAGELADAIGQLQEEWVEEAGIPADEIQAVRAIGLLQSENGYLYDLCYRIDLRAGIRFAEHRLAGEYINAIAAPAVELLRTTRGRKMVPVSRVLLGVVA